MRLDHLLSRENSNGLLALSSWLLVETRDERLVTNDIRNPRSVISDTFLQEKVS